MTPNYTVDDTLKKGMTSQDNNVVIRPASDENKSFGHNEIKGRFNQYTSGFWALALPALSARYVGRYLVEMDLFNKKPPVELKDRPNRTYAGLVGAWIMGITGFYAARNYADMKRVFSETVGYEFDKKPEDVGLRDLLNSKNDIVHRTVQNFIKYNTRRAGVASTFFAFVLPGKFHTSKADSVDLGVGATGAYLYSDVLKRKITFFEALQNFIDQKINHVESVGQLISDNDLMNLYAIHARDKSPSHKVAADRMDTIAWRNDQVIFGRMAELMNQTYRNAPNKEGADFTVPKLIYLLGENLITRDNIEQSMAYIEIANRHGIKAVKQVAKAVSEGMAFEEAAAAFPVNVAKAKEEAAQVQPDPAPSFVTRLTELKQKETQQPDLRSL